MGTEHESKFSEMAADSVKTTAMRAMLPKDVLERFLDGPFQYEELRIVCLHMWERSWLDKVRTVELNPWTLDRSTSPKERTKMTMQFNSAVRMIDPISRTANSSPSAPRQSTPRDKKPESGETKQSAGKKKRLICYRCGGKGHPVRLCPSADDCQDVNEVGTEPSSDADSDLFGLDWGDDPIATTQ